MSNVALPASTPRRQIDALTLGAKVLGVATLMAMFGLAAVYMQARSEATVWPPKGVSLNLYSSMLVAITALMSFVTAAWARSAERRGVHRQALVGVLVTAGLQLATINAAAILVNRFGFGVATNTYTVSVYAMVIVAVAALAGSVIAGLTIALRSSVRQTQGVHFDRLRAFTTYAQFAAVSWLIVYFVVYQFK